MRKLVTGGALGLLLLSAGAPDATTVLIAGAPALSAQRQTVTAIIVPLGTSQTVPELTSLRDGVAFDLDADGFLDQTSWTAADSDVAFLVMDRDGDGQITSGSELFGGHTWPGARNGVVALAEMQFAESGVRKGDITAEDPFYSKLLLWKDSNHNGVSESSELVPFSRQFAAISLAYKPIPRADGSGNLFDKGDVVLRTAPGVNRWELRDGQRRTVPVYDVVLRTGQ